MIQQLKSDYPLRLLCETLDCPTSTAYYQPVERDEAGLMAAIEQILMTFPFYGYRKVHAELARRNMAVSEHVVRRLLGQLGHSRSVGKVRVRTTDSHHAHPRYPNRIRKLRPSRPDQVWVTDITYIRSDQGSQYAAWDHTQHLLDVGATISMSDVASPTQNGLVERFMRTMKE